MSPVPIFDFYGTSSYLFRGEVSKFAFTNRRLMASTSDFKPGLTIRMDGDLWTVVEFQHVNPGNWRAFVRTKLKSLRTGKVVETRFRAGEALDVVRMETKNFQYLYHDGSGFVFMDKETYDQMSVDQKVVGPGAQFLREGESVEILFNGNDIIALEIPITVELKVVETPPGVRGDTATGAQKPAKVETGATVNVPLFINEGDRIKVDTRTGSYIERVKAA